ncbi:MAG: DUF4124 domain-containing protein [Steroidobacteraceae bacterium]|jgi:uncharacterized protein DUF4124
MHLCRTWIALGLSALVSAAPAAVVYKWVDADGVVHFSDQPVPGAEKIFTSGASTRGILSQPAPSGGGGQDKQKPPSKVIQHVAITSPAPDQTFTGGQQVSASLSAEPALAPSQLVSWTLNGAPVGEESNATDLTLPDLARGTYTLSATVSDSVSGQSISADPVTFNVMRPSVMSPQHK